MNFSNKQKILGASTEDVRKFKKIIAALSPLNVPWDIETELNLEEREKYK